MSPSIIRNMQPMLPFEEFESDLAVSPADDLKVDDPLYFMSFGSGSSGNSCYIGTDRGGIIVDAGVKTDHIEMSLRKHGIKMQDVKALLLTHDHSDHVRYAYSLLRTNRHMWAAWRSPHSTCRTTAATTWASRCSSDVTVSCWPPTSAKWPNAPISTCGRPTIW